MDKNLSFKEYGKGYPIILLHAFPLSSFMWEDLAEFLAARNWRVIAPDFPGFGESPLSSEISKMEDLAQMTTDLFSELKIEKAVISGLSMGGYAALNFTRLFPEKVEALILADTSAAADTEEKRKSRFELIESLKEKGSEVLIEKMLPNLISDSAKEEKPELLKKLKDTLRNAAPDSAIAALRGMAERKDHTQFLDEIRIPTLLIFGEDDKITNLEAAKVLNDNISNSELVIIPNAGHLSNLEDPQAFNKAVGGFLDKLKIENE